MSIKYTVTPPSLSLSLRHVVECYLLDQLHCRSLYVSVHEQPPMDVGHGFLVAQYVPHAVAGQYEEVVGLGELDRVYVWP